jgi:vitellogenic carboxypeptidase-like protein
MSTTNMTDDRVLSLPGLDTPGNKVAGVQFAGYMPVTGSVYPKGPDAGLFYWFVGTDDYATRPTIIWTNGGPGSSSFWGFFLENGPYEITYPEGGSPTVTTRATAWNQYANYMVFEHPLSVTMSFAKDADVPKTVEQGMEQYYQALLNFLAKHPEIAKNPIILAGESYAGTYLPLLAKEIVKGNASKGGTVLNLVGTVLLDAWVDPWTQMAQDTNYAFTHGLISAAQKEILDNNISLPNMATEIETLSGVYMANIAGKGDPPFDPVTAYLNNDDFRKAVHAPAVGPDTKVTQNWSAVVSNNYAERVNESYRDLVRDLLEGTGPDDKARQTILVISGLNDAKDCNFLGTGEWLNKLDGFAASRFKMAGTTQWKSPDGKEVLGFEQNGGQLRWLKVLNAGHLAVLDQPLLIEYILDALGQPIPEKAIKPSVAGLPVEGVTVLSRQG